MLKNYLLVTFRNLLKNKVFTLINIIGLGIALSVCIVAFFNHMFNYEFDRTHENFHEIYRITCFRDMQGREKDYLSVQNRARQDFIINRFNLIPLKDVGKSTRTIWSSGLFPSLHPAAVIAPPVMALFILLIACFNFANTSRSIFSKRLKEIGLRKAFGGLRKQLVTQFMFEPFIICLLALFAGIILAEFLVPGYSNLWAYMSIELTLTRYTFFWAFIIILVLITGFLSGVYPALYVSSFIPVNVIRGDSTVKGSGKLSIILLTLQFSISVMSLVMGVVVDWYV
ncbi:MAG: FtsX-like permease family protein [Bacteroidales bacterium]|nr:FtsX-like permease family protein [Bacteroidales bacterium]